MGFCTGWKIWTLAWDPYLQQAQIAYFFGLMDALVYQTLQISKTNTTVSDVFIPSGLSGVFTAVLRACDSNNACSANSNQLCLIIITSPGRQFG